MNILAMERTKPGRYHYLYVGSVEINLLSKEKHISEILGLLDDISSRIHVTDPDGKHDTNYIAEALDRLISAAGKFIGNKKEEQLKVLSSAILKIETGTDKSAGTLSVLIKMLEREIIPLHEGFKACLNEQQWIAE